MWNVVLQGEAINEKDTNHTFVLGTIMNVPIVASGCGTAEITLNNIYSWDVLPREDSFWGGEFIYANVWNGSYEWNSYNINNYSHERFHKLDNATDWKITLWCKDKSNRSVRVSFFVSWILEISYEWVSDRHFIFHATYADFILREASINEINSGSTNPLFQHLVIGCHQYFEIYDY